MGRGFNLISALALPCTHCQQGKAHAYSAYILSFLRSPALETWLLRGLPVGRVRFASSVCSDRTVALPLCR